MRAEKQLLLDEIKEAIEGSNAMILVSYKEFPANETAAFRQKLVDEAHSEFKAVPKRIFLKAAKESGISLDNVEMEGHLGIALTKEDPIGLTKKLFKFADESGEKISVLAGHLDGKVYSSSDMKELSMLPSLQQMRAEFLGVLEAPMSQTVAVIESIMTSVIYCLENKSKQGEEAN